MIGSEREALLDQRTREDNARRQGGPLAMFGLILVVWVTGRAVLWESPFPAAGMIDQATQLLAQAPPETGTVPGSGNAIAAIVPATAGASAQRGRIGQKGRALRPDVAGIARAAAQPSGAAFNQQVAWLATRHDALLRTAWRTQGPRFERANMGASDRPFFPGAPPFAGKYESSNAAGRAPSRWSVDSWAFLREGSGAAPISQGRVPVYGASQIGANLQYRAAPGSGHDPRLYVRAYRALIDPAESEIAAGVSARPLARVPLRLAAELRATDDRFRSELRPAAYVVTEIAPVALPFGLSGEVYAGAGYVGGAADTGFIDAQGTVTRRVASFDLRREDDVRLSVGAGAWGGAQRDADRIDVGPTMRLDLSIGTVPARVSIDYRERVGGDAAPASGLAATLSTRF